MSSRARRSARPAGPGQPSVSAALRFNAGWQQFMGVELQLKTNIDSSDKLVDITWEIRPRRDGSGALRFNAGWQQQVAAGRLLEAIRGSSWPASRARAGRVFKTILPACTASAACWHFASTAPELALDGQLPLPAGIPLPPAFRFPRPRAGAGWTASTSCWRRTMFLWRKPSLGHPH